MRLPLLRWISQLLTLISLLWSLVILFIVSLIIFWGVNIWYNYQEGNRPITWGVSWSSKQAEALGLNSEQALATLLDQIPFKRIQLHSYWDLGEPKPQQYDISRLENHFRLAQSHNLAISLQLGLHQSRQPYCHQPAHTKTSSSAQLKASLKAYLRVVVDHFDEEVNLIQYQLEPEIAQARSRACPHQLSSADLAEIYAYLKTLTKKDIALSRTHNRLSLLAQKPSPDALGLKLHPHPTTNPTLWERHVTQRTVSATYYNFLAGSLKIKHPQSHIFIRQLQTEPEDLKAPSDQSALEKLEKQLSYARQSKLRTIDVLGAEWWFWQKENHSDALWLKVTEVIKADF